MTFDFLSFYVQVEIEKNGVVYDKNSFPALFNSVSMVKAEIRMNEIAKIEITLTPSYQDAIDILRSGLLGIGNSPSVPDSDSSNKSSTSINTSSGNSAVASSSGSKDPLRDTLKNFSNMRVKFMRPLDNLTSQGKMETPWYVGAITQPDVRIEGAEVTITLKGYAFALFMSGPKMILEIKDGDSVYDVVEKVLGLIDHTMVFDQDDATTEEEMRSKKLIGEKRSQPPFNILKWALSLVGCDFVLGANVLSGEESDKSGNQVLIRKRQSTFEQPPVYTLVQWRNPDPQADPPEIPIVNFSLESGGPLFFNGFAFGVFRLGEDPLKKKVIIPEALESRNFKETATTPSSSKKANSDDTNKIGMRVPVHSDQESEQSQTSDSAVNEMEKQLINFQKFVIDIPGVPGIAPTNLCMMRIGTLDEMSGYLLVTSVTHTADSSGWMTSLEARMTGGLDGNQPQQVKAMQPGSRSLAGGSDFDRSLV